MARKKKEPRSAYITSALTELSEDVQELFKFVLSRTADLCEEVLGVRGFAPHEHNDPVHQPDKTPPEVDKQEREQVTKKTSVLLVYTLAPSWGGGIEVEMANTSKVPIVILRQVKRDQKTKGVISRKKVSRLLLGNPGVRKIIEFETYDELFGKLATVLPNLALPAYE